jgi:hypothetical protein
MTIQDTLKQLWDALETEVMEVLDCEGNNIPESKMREVKDGIWLYVDCVDGFSLLTPQEVASLNAEGFSMKPGEKETT